LRVVNDEPETPPGDESITREAVSSWSSGQRRCRGRRRHNWGPANVFQHAQYYEVVERCSHCGNRRSAEFVPTTYGLRKTTPWKPLYRDGYLLPKGAMPITEDLQDELVAADILSRKIVEVDDE
jgi:hypothetical protein